MCCGREHYSSSSGTLALCILAGGRAELQCLLHYTGQVILELLDMETMGWSFLPSSPAGGAVSLREHLIYPLAFKKQQQQPYIHA